MMPRRAIETIWRQQPAVGQHDRQRSDRHHSRQRIVITPHVVPDERRQQMHRPRRDLQRRAVHYNRQERVGAKSGILFLAVLRRVSTDFCNKIGPKLT
jgi:hypothetical protein